MLFIVLSAASLAGTPSTAPSDSHVEDFAEWHAGDLMDWCSSAASTGNMTGTDGFDVAYAAFTDSDNEGKLIISVGRTESWVKYCEVVYDLQGLGMDIWVIDHRGQGLSERLLSDGDKGYVRDFSDYVDDLETFIEDIVGASEDEDVFVLGHSLGGTIATQLAATHEDLIDGLILSAPMFGLNTSPYPESVSYWLAWAADWWGYGASYALGRGPYTDFSFADNGVTSSEGRYTAHRDQRITWPALQLGGPTWSFLYESMDATQSIVSVGSGFDIPTLLLQAGSDDIVTPAHQTGFCAAATDCTLVDVDGGEHELLQEADSIRGDVLSQISDFIGSH